MSEKAKGYNVESGSEGWEKKWEEVQKMSTVYIYL